MKKIFIAILIIVSIFSLMACSTANTVNNDEDVESEISDVVNSRAYAHCFLNYADVKGVVTDIATIDDNGDGTYDVYGTVIVNDNYNDHYEGKFDAVVSIDASGEGSCDSFSLETPVKQNY